MAEQWQVPIEGSLKLKVQIMPGDELAIGRAARWGWNGAGRSLNPLHFCRGGS